jgi:hypothetical protein
LTLAKITYVSAAAAAAIAAPAMFGLALNRISQVCL